MRHARCRLRCFGFLVSTAALSACGTSPGGAGGGGHGGGDAGGGGAGTSIALTVRFIDAVTKLGLSGVHVCAEGHADFPCEDTGPGGVVTVSLPKETELLLGCTKDGHVPTYMTLTTGREDVDVGVFRLLDEATTATFVSLAGASQDPTKGILVANAYDDIVERDTRVDGATFSLDPAGGKGPIYGGVAGPPDPKLTGSTTGGPAMFFELDPGDRTVTIAHPARACERGFGWPGASETAARTKVIAGGMSTVTFVCPP